MYKCSGPYFSRAATGQQIANKQKKVQNSTNKNNNKNKHLIERQAERTKKDLDAVQALFEKASKTLENVVTRALLVRATDAPCKSKSLIIFSSDYSYTTNYKIEQPKSKIRTGINLPGRIFLLTCFLFRFTTSQTNVHPLYFFLRKAM